LKPRALSIERPEGRSFDPNLRRLLQFGSEHSFHVRTDAAIAAREQVLAPLPHCRLPLVID
jgi:hypothetical protein